LIDPAGQFIPARVLPKLAKLPTNEFIDSPFRGILSITST
jgi:hypothetical protein